MTEKPRFLVQQKPERSVTANLTVGSYIHNHFICKMCLDILGEWARVFLTECEGGEFTPVKLITSFASRHQLHIEVASAYCEQTFQLLFTSAPLPFAIQGGQCLVSFR